MRVLQLCHKPPLPAIDGGCLAMDAITQGTSRSRVSMLPPVGLITSTSLAPVSIR